MVWSFPMSRDKRILFAVLGWGLGHATRSIPLIREESEKHRLIIASSGAALRLLQDEFPDLDAVEFPDYDIYYPNNKYLVIPSLGLQLPKILVQLFREFRLTQKLVSKYHIQRIISDCCYGVFSTQVPCFFITHQLRFMLTGLLRCLVIPSEWFNRYMFRHYKRIIVPDTIQHNNLAGSLAHSGSIATHPKLFYLGILSSVQKQDLNEDIDILFSVSGPEKQRTRFEKLIFNQLPHVPGKKVVVLGKPGGSASGEKHKDTIKFNYADRQLMNELMNRAKLIVCRPGYSTVMELVALNKSALFIPTPGQAEQEYLGRYYQQTGLFQVANQNHLDLPNVIGKIRQNACTTLPDVVVNDTSKFLQLIA